MLVALLRDQRGDEVRRCADRAVRGEFAGPHGAMGSFWISVRVDAHGMGGRARSRVLTDSAPGFGRCLAEVARTLTFAAPLWGRELTATVHLGDRPEAHSR